VTPFHGRRQGPTSRPTLTATYRDGILEIQVPMPSGPTPVEKIPVTRGWHHVPVLSRQRGGGRFAGRGWRPL